MLKHHFKQIINILDQLEIQDILWQDIKAPLLKEARHVNDEIEEYEIEQVIDFCSEFNQIKHLSYGFDLSQPLCVYARSKNNSISEALAMFEVSLYDSFHLEKLNSMIHSSFTMEKLYELYHNHSFIHALCCSILFIQKGNHFTFNESLKKYCSWICEEKQHPIYISNCLKASYTFDLYNHKHLTMRNEDRGMIDYHNKKQLLSIFPTLGIPTDRDESKELQGFFKDCLHHEFEHQCPICKARLSRLLIASHIKPFRDCGYLVEAMDHNNGFLLCRNHDALFDLGYISFYDDGKIMICDTLLKEKQYESYMISPDTQIDKKYMSDSRKKFLAYHREYIYQKE